MTDFAHHHRFTVAARRAPRKPLPVGYGLVAAAAVSLGLWFGLWQLVAAIL